MWFEECGADDIQSESELGSQDSLSHPDLQQSPRNPVRLRSKTNKSMLDHSVMSNCFINSTECFNSLSSDKTL